jgi:hypothetical protein
MYRHMFEQSLSRRIAAGPGWTCPEEWKTTRGERSSPVQPSKPSVVDRRSESEIRKERNNGMKTDGDRWLKNERPIE